MKQNRRAYVQGKRAARTAANQPLPFGPELIDEYGVLHDDL